MQQTDHKTTKSFISFSLITVLLTFGLIVFGAVVRVTDSGLGCGNDWPLCDGRIFPPLDNITAWIEWLHRLFAVVIGLFGLGMLYHAWRGFRTHNRAVLNITGVAAAIFAFQSILGGLVVMYDLPPTMVTMHLGTAMLLLAALIIAGIAAWHKPQAIYERDHITLLAYITTALTLVIILSGALVRGSGATLACLTWPLCNGDILPLQQGQLQTVHMMHRLAVAGLGLTLALLTWYIFQSRESKLLRMVTLGAGITYLLQSLVGAVFVWTSAAAVWGSAHVGLAALTWGFLVAVCAIDTMNSREMTAEQDTKQWMSQSETATQ